MGGAARPRAPKRDWMLWTQYYVAEARKTAACLRMTNGRFLPGFRVPRRKWGGGIVSQGKYI